jgi:hypothetical protein
VLLRRVRSTLAATIAVGGMVLLVPAAPTSAAGLGSSPTLTLLAQSDSVTPVVPGDPATFGLDIGISGTTPAGSDLDLTFYHQLGTRSAFEQTLSGPPTNVLQTLSPVPVSGLKPGLAGGFQDNVTVAPDTAEAAGSNGVDLRCEVGNGSCSGVYPVTVGLVEPSGNVVSHLTTYLTYAEERSTNPLVFSWVVTIGSPVRIRPRAGLSTALAPVSSSRVSDLDQLARALDSPQNDGVRVSIAASPATLQQLGSGRGRSALTAISQLAVAGPNTHRFLAQPYVPINLGALSAAGVTTEIAGQMAGAASVMTPLLHGLPVQDQPTPSIWVSNGAVDAAIIKGLSDAHASSLVLPDSDLAPATEREATWSQPFTLSTGRGQQVRAAAADGQLSSYFTAEPNDPVLAATQLLADLAMIYYELPGAADTRGVVAVPPSDWDPNPRFVNALLAGLAGDPVVQTATLPEFFSSVPAGGNQAVTTRHLSSNQSGQQIGSAEAAAIVTAREQITGFATAVQGDPTVKNQLEDVLLASESSDLRQATQRAGLAIFERQLDTELSNIQVVGNTITLTARTASIPITIVSSASYRLQGTLTLSSSKLEFPEGDSRTVAIDHPTNSIRIEVRARTSGDLPLAYTLTSPDGALVITRGRLTVRSTATSIVGILLTVAAAVVLLGWWARTWYGGRKQRRARPARGRTP